MKKNSNFASCLREKKLNPKNPLIQLWWRPLVIKLPFTDAAPAFSYTTRYILQEKHVAASPPWVDGGLQAAFGL